MAEFRDKLTLIDNVCKPLRNIQQKFDDFNAKISKTHPNLGKFQTKLQTIGVNLQAFGAKMQAAGAKMSAFGAKMSMFWAGAVAGATIWFNKVKGALDQFADFGDSIDKNSQKIGMSRKAYQEWSYIMSQNGGNVDSLKMGFKTLGTQMNGVIKGSKSSVSAFKALGVSVKDSNGQLRNQDDVFNDVITALQKVDNQTQKNILANQLFGRSAVELKPLLNQNAEATEALRKKANDLGLIISDTDIKNAAKYKDTMNTLGQVFQTKFANVALQCMPKLTEAMNNLLNKKDTLDKLVGAVSSFAGAIVNLVVWFANLNTPLQSIIIGIVAFLGILAPLITGIGALATALGSIAAVLGITLTATMGWAVAIAAAIAAVIAVIVLCCKNWEKIKEVAGKVWNTVKNATINAIKSMCEWINKLLDKLGFLAYLIPGLNILKSTKDLSSVIRGRNGTTTNNKNTTTNNSDNRTTNNKNTTTNNSDNRTINNNTVTNNNYNVTNNSYSSIRPLTTALVPNY